jgi:hypothetical protein
MKFIFALFLVAMTSSLFAGQTCEKCVARDSKYQAVCDSTKAMTNYGMDREEACNVQAAFCDYKVTEMKGSCVAMDPSKQGVCNTTKTFINYGMSPEQACNVQAAFCEYKEPVCR